MLSNQESQRPLVLMMLSNMALIGQQLQLKPVAQLGPCCECVLMNLSLCLIRLGQRVSEERRQAAAFLSPWAATAARQVMGHGRWSGSALGGGGLQGF